ncbi:MAG: hypothetical protein DSY43_06250 [Gammaproteobacteria bacterium]|nr:MAG: hypothetical protein DSY43_06250 [Gammaproteobacteria bacterium]
MVPRLFVPAVRCPDCYYPNDEDFRFCQRCGYSRHLVTTQDSQPLRFPVDCAQIKARFENLRERRASTPYSRQKSALEKELSGFLQKIPPGRDLNSATPEDVIHFLIWKDNGGKTKVHEKTCSGFGSKRDVKCACPTRLSFGSVDSLIGKLRAIFAIVGRGSHDSELLGYGNPAASKKVKEYLSVVKEEQLEARIVPSQAEPFFLTDLLVVAKLIGDLITKPGVPSKQVFVLARDQAFLKLLFFAGDRAGDLSHIKSQEILYFPNKEGFLFNHTLTKSLRDGTTNVFGVRRYLHSGSICPVAALEVYINVCDLMKVPVRQGYLFRPLNPSGEVVNAPLSSSAIQARLAYYVNQLPDTFAGRKITLHGLRSGCAISLALAGTQLLDIMSHVGWKTSKMANHYLKLNRVLSPGGAGDRLAGVSLNLSELYQRQNNLIGFTNAFDW